MIDRRLLLTGSAALLAASRVPALAQQKTEITISRQPGIIYLPTHVIEKQGLIEKHAEKLGVKGVTTKWVSFSNGGAQQDALLSGNVDMINTGTGPLLLMWDRTKGGVKGVVASSALPLMLITRDPRIQSLKDFRDGDKIAVPTVRVSTQAILLQIAAAQQFGPGEWGRFDPLTIQMGHPDAYIVMKNAIHEVKSHFAAPPFQHYEMKSVPGARALISSSEIMGGGLSQGQFIATTKFADANPLLIKALRAAAEEAKAFIEAHTPEAVEIYREVTADKTSAADILELLAQPGMMEWNLHPQGTMKFAEHLNMVGSLKTKPASFKDYYLPIAHDLPGN